LVDPGDHSWQPSAALPLALGKIEELARAELRKIAQDEPNWVVTDFRVSRFDSAPGWYYAATLKPEIELDKKRPQSYTLLVDFSGSPGRTGHMITPNSPQ
jgi:hypothetical protein